LSATHCTERHKLPPESNDLKMKDARTLAEIKRQGNGNRVPENTAQLTVNFIAKMCAAVAKAYTLRA
jgi:hypothetical protein